MRKYSLFFIALGLLIGFFVWNISTNLKIKNRSIFKKKLIYTFYLRIFILNPFFWINNIY